MSDVRNSEDDMVPLPRHAREAVIVSADAEWRQVRKLFAGAEFLSSPYGEYFFIVDMPVYQGGWGKIAAAASAQYVIDRWQPDVLINLGTCGGIAGHVERHRIILASKTIVYDIAEQMSDAEVAIEFYTTDIDLAWLGERLPTGIRAAPICSADRDLAPADIQMLVTKYEAIVADWESASIAWVAARNGKRVLILRCVTDLVGADGGQIYGKSEIFEQEAAAAMKILFNALPQWLELLRSSD